MKTVFLKKEKTFWSTLINQKRISIKKAQSYSPMTEHGKELRRVRNFVKKMFTSSLYLQAVIAADTSISSGNKL